MSLSVVFDNTNATDLLKTLSNILTEYDQSKDEIDKPKMVELPSVDFIPHTEQWFYANSDSSDLLKTRNDKQEH